jgi:hypothetical protein
MTIGLLLCQKANSQVGDFETLEPGQYNGGRLIQSNRERVDAALSPEVYASSFQNFLGKRITITGCVRNIKGSWTLSPSKQKQLPQISLTMEKTLVFLPRTENKTAFDKLSNSARINFFADKIVAVYGKVQPTGTLCVYKVVELETSELFKKSL